MVRGLCPGEYVRQHLVPLWHCRGSGRLVFAVRAGMDNYFEDRSFTIIYVPAVLFAAFAGGRGPAILTTLLCLLISAKFLGRSLVTEPEI